MCASGSGGFGRYRLRLLFLGGGEEKGEMGSYSVGDLHCNLFTLFISQHILHSLLLDIVLKF